MKIETEYFKERIVAYLIDYIMIFLIMSFGLIFISMILAFGPEMSEEEFNRFYNSFVYISFWVVSLGYFIISEWRFSTTVGKMICVIGVVNESDLESEEESEEISKISLKQSAIRNLSKMRMELMLIDMIIGLYMNPSKIQRAGAIISKTTTTEIPDPLALRTKQSKKVRRMFKRVLAIGGAFFLSIHLITDALLILDLIT